MRRQRPVVAIDGFSDADLKADRTVRVNLEEGQFTPEILEIVSGLSRPGDVLAYGSGFEAYPELLEELQSHVRILGNSPDVIRLCADPVQRSDRLAKLGVSSPEVQLRAPDCPGDWLMKRKGRSGGHHVIPGTWTACDSGQNYWQRFCAGQSYSALFLSAERESRVVGISQLLPADTEKTPYAWSGAIGPVDVLPELFKQVQWVAQTLTRDLGLLGLCGIDFIVDIRKELQVVDLNPRLVATCELYKARFAYDYMTAHVETCLTGRLDEQLASGTAETDSVYGMQVIYAPWVVSGAEAWSWPDGSADLPNEGVRIEAGQPLCTVRGCYSGLAAARTGLKDLRRQVLAKISPDPTLSPSTEKLAHEVTH